MKFIVSSSAMLSHVQAVSNKVIGGKPIQPILDNVLLVAKDGVLYATASDKETTIEAHIELEQMDEAGSITIPAKNLLDLLKEFSDQPLTFNVEESTGEVNIITDNGKYSVHGESAADYPQPRQMDGEKVTMTTSCGLMLDGVSKSFFATGNDELRPIMNCILLEMSEECYTFVASDAHKLVRYKRFDAKSANGQYSLIIPKKPASILKTILPKDESPLNFMFSENLACFEFGDFKMTFTLQEGRFPNYNAVIPQENPFKMIIERKTIYNALRRVSVMGNQSSGAVKLDLSNGQLQISAQDMDYSMSGQETLPCQFEGGDLSIGFKSSYLLEIIANIESENIILELTNPTRPGIFLPFENENKDEELLMLLMPMMV